ncbi:hypothetical protein [Peribacillus frigoritolerans]|uniref:hypothetical protein n=1 Tax=Peribacillus frigoritolerans TaxID=450367 RepID=UPI0032E39D4C
MVTTSYASKNTKIYKMPHKVNEYYREKLKENNLGKEIANEVVKNILKNEKKD